MCIYMAYRSPNLLFYIYTHIYIYIYVYVHIIYETDHVLCMSPICTNMYILYIYIYVHIGTYRYLYVHKIYETDQFYVCRIYSKPILKPMLKPIWA